MEDIVIWFHSCVHLTSHIAYVHCCDLLTCISLFVGVFHAVTMQLSDESCCSRKDFNENSVIFNAYIQSIVICILLYNVNIFSLYMNKYTLESSHYSLKQLKMSKMYSEWANNPWKHKMMTYRVVQKSIIFPI